MRQVSDKFKSQDTRTAIVRVTLVNTDGTTTVLTEADIPSVSVSQSCAGSNSFGVGSTQSTKATIKVRTTMLPTVFVTASFHVEFGYRWDDVTYDAEGNVTSSVERTEYTSMGWFATNDALTYRSGLYTYITAYDAMYWLSDNPTAAMPARGTSVSLRGLLTTVLTGTSIVVHDINELPNISLKQYRPYGNIRDCIGIIAAAAFKNATFDGNGKLRFISPNASGIVVTQSDYSMDGLTVSGVQPASINSIAVTVNKTYEPIQQAIRDEAGNIEVDDDGNTLYEFVYVDDAERYVSYTAPEQVQVLTVDLDAKSFVENGTINIDSSSSDGGAEDNIVSDVATIGAASVSSGCMPIAFPGFTLDMFNMLHVEVMDTLTIHDADGKILSGYTPMSCEYSFNGAFTTKLATDATVDDVAQTTSIATVASLSSDVSNAAATLLSVRNMVVGSLKGDNAEFNNMVANRLRADYLDIGAGNATDLTVTNLFSAKTGVVDNITVSDCAVVEGELRVLTIDGDLIKAKTLKADHILLLGDDGLYYAMNANGTSTSAADAENAAHATSEYQAWVAAQENGSDDSVVEAAEAAYKATDEYKELEVFQSGIDGSNIIAKTVSADALDVTDLSTVNATIGGWVIHNDAIARKGATADGVNGTYLGSNGYIRLDASSDKGIEFSSGGTIVANITPYDVGTTGGTSAKFTINNAEVRDMLQFGNFGWVTRSNGHTSLKRLVPYGGNV